MTGHGDRLAICVCGRIRAARGRCVCMGPKTRAVDRRPARSARGYDGTWYRLRAIILAEQPLCVRCLREGKHTPAVDVHHIVPVRQDPALRLEPDNLMPVCRACHSVLDRQWRRMLVRRRKEAARLTDGQTEEAARDPGP